jgi:hypothetical protein
MTPYQWAGFIGLTGTLACLCLPLAALAASRPVEGCQILRDRGSEVCMAKVSCDAAAAAVRRVRPLFAGCAAGQQIPRQTVLQALSQFESDLYFQCCIGNALAPSLNGAGFTD